MIVSYGDAGIGMVAFEMMIGMILMIQTAFQCLSRSGINKEKRKKDSSDFSHGIISGTSFSKRQLEDIAFLLLRISSSASQSS